MNNFNNNMNDFKNFALKDQGISSLRAEEYIKNQNKNKTVGFISPIITEDRVQNVAQMDVFSRLMMERIIFLGDAIDDYVANIIQAQLLFLRHTDKDKDIHLYINSPGGVVSAGLGILDTMEFIPCDVRTLNTGTCASMGAVLLAAGEKGKRKSLKHSRTMIHQPMGGAYGQASDIEIANREIQFTKKELYSILSDCTGQSIETIEKDSDRDRWFGSAEAQEYGLIDSVMIRK